MSIQPDETQPDLPKEVVEPFAIPEVTQGEGYSNDRRGFLKDLTKTGATVFLLPRLGNLGMNESSVSRAPRRSSRRDLLSGRIGKAAEQPPVAVHKETVTIGSRMDAADLVIDVFDSVPMASRFTGSITRRSELQAIHPRYSDHPVVQDFNPSNPDQEVRITPNFRTREVSDNEVYLAQLLFESNGLQTPEQRIIGFLNEIYGHEPTFVIEVYNEAGTRVPKSYSELTNEEKGCVMAYARGLEFFRDTMKILKSSGDASGTRAKLFLESQVEEFKVIIDTSKRYIPSAATGVAYDPTRGDVSKVGQYITSISDVEAELPHGVFLMGKRSLRTTAQMAVEGSADGFRSHPHIEAMSNLTHSVFAEMAEADVDQYPSLSINGGGRSFLYVIADGLALREPPSLDEYLFTVEAWGYEIAREIYDAIEVLNRLPECLNGERPAGMLPTGFELLKKKYAGVVGLLRVMNTITSTDLSIDNNQVDAFINACDSAIQQDLRKVYEKLKELNVTSIISSASYNNLRNYGGVLSEVRRDDVLEPSFNGQYWIAVIQGIAVQINNDPGDEPRFEFKQSQIVDNETSNSNTKVMVEVRRQDGTVGYVDATSLVSMFHGVDASDKFNGLTTLMIPKMYSLDGQGAIATGNVILVAEMTKPTGIGDELKETQGHSMYFNN